MPESTPRVGRWRVVGHESLPVWTCDCGYYPYMAHVVTAPCGCVRPPLPETPAPRVDDAGEPTPAEVIAWLSSDNPVGLSTSRHARKMLAVALAALRAVPVEGGEPVAWALWHHIGYLHTGCVYRADNDLGAWAKGQAEALAAEKNAALGHDSYCAIPLYAHPAPDARDA